MYFSESCGRREGLYHSQEMGHVDLEPYFDLSGGIISQYIYVLFAILSNFIKWLIINIIKMVCTDYMNLPKLMWKHTIYSCKMRERSLN